MFFYFLITVFWGCVWGYVTNSVIHNRGYDENWFWWGFFFSFIPLIVAFSKPEKHKVMYNGGNSSYNTNESDIIAQGGWKCSCGRTNYSYVSTCTCGINKRDMKKLSFAPSEEKAETESGISLIKQYKELLDCGAITQEEFEAKKKQLLGL